MLDDGVLADLAAKVRKRAQAGNRPYQALDEVLLEELPKGMHSSDKLMVRDALIELLTDDVIKEFKSRSTTIYVIGGGYEHGGPPGQRLIEEIRPLQQAVGAEYDMPTLRPRLKLEGPTVRLRKERLGQIELPED